MVKHYPGAKDYCSNRSDSLVCLKGTANNLMFTGSKKEDGLLHDFTQIIIMISSSNIIARKIQLSNI